MSDYNNVELIGRLGKDPEMKSGVARLTLATTSGYKDKSGNFVEKTEWHRCVAFGRTAETVCEFLKKGSQVHIAGPLRYGEYTDKAGVKKYTTDIVVNRCDFLGKPAGGNTKTVTEDDVPF